MELSFDAFSQRANFGAGWDLIPARHRRGRIAGPGGDRLPGRDPSLRSAHPGNRPPARAVDLGWQRARSHGACGQEAW